MSNHRKRVNYTGEEKVAILRAHFVEGLLVQKNEVIAELLQEHVQLKKANGDPSVDAGSPTTPVIRSSTL